MRHHVFGSRGTPDAQEGPTAVDPAGQQQVGNSHNMIGVQVREKQSRYFCELYGNLRQTLRRAAPRSQSNSNFSVPASTNMLGPKRSIRGAGQPVLRSVTVRPRVWGGACPCAHAAKAAVATSSKTSFRHRSSRSRVVLFIGRDLQANCSGSLLAQCNPVKFGLSRGLISDSGISLAANPCHDSTEGG